MKWGEFKSLVKLNTIGELQLPDDEALKLALEAVIINDIASFVTPTRLIEQDIEKAEMLFSFPKTKNFFIRKPFAPADDESEIDLDNELCHTAVFYVSELFLKDSLERFNTTLVSVRAVEQQRFFTKSRFQYNACVGSSVFLN